MALNKGEVASEATAGDEVELMSFASGEQTALTVAPEATAHIARLLTEKLYNFPIAATVRETVSNAIDATNRAVSNGSDFIPVDVQTPNPTSPFFIVTDRGTGMSAKDMTSIFSSVGLGTKRGDYAQIGSWGLGSRAPLSYVSAYTITSTQDGITTSVEVNQPNGIPGMRLLSSARTDQPNGTTVTIPVKNIASDGHEFESAIYSYKLYSFANPIRIDDVLYDVSKEYLRFGEMVLDDETDTRGAVYVKKDSINNLIARAASEYANPILLGYSLGGGYYQTPQANQREGLEASRNLSHYKPDVMVDLVPGVVDFSSSRDEITRNDRSDQLFNKVLTVLSNSGGFLDKGLASVFPSMSDEYVRSLLFIGSIVEKEDGSVTYTQNKNSQSFAHTVSRTPVTLPRNLFTVSNGRNLIDDLVKYHGNDSVRTMISFGTSGGGSIGANTSGNPAFGKATSLVDSKVFFTGLNLTKIKSVAMDAFRGEEKMNGDFPANRTARISLMGSITRGILRNRTSTRMYLIETDSADVIGKVVSKRKSIVSEEAESDYVEFAFSGAGDISDDEIAAVNTLGSGKVTLSRLSVEDFLEQDKVYRAKQRTSKDTIKREVSVNLYRASNGVDSHHALLTAGIKSLRPTTQDATIVLSEVENPVFVVAAADYAGNMIFSESIRRTLNGMYHEFGEAILNRPIYAVSRPSKAALEYLDEVSGGMVGFHASANAVGTHVIEYANSHRFGREVAVDLVSAATGEQLTRLVSGWYSISRAKDSFKTLSENPEHRMYRVFNEDHTKMISDSLQLLSGAMNEYVLSLYGVLSRNDSMPLVRDRLGELYGDEYLDLILALGDYSLLFSAPYRSHSCDSRVGVIRMVETITSGVEVPAELSTPVIEFARRDVAKIATEIAAALQG